MRVFGWSATPPPPPPAPNAMDSRHRANSGPRRKAPPTCLLRVRTLGRDGAEQLSKSGYKEAGGPCPVRDLGDGKEGREGICRNTRQRRDQRSEMHCGVNQPVPVTALGRRRCGVGAVLVTEWCHGEQGGASAYSHHTASMAKRLDQL